MLTERFANDIARRANRFTARSPGLAVWWREVRILIIATPPGSAAPLPATQAPSTRLQAGHIATITVILAYLGVVLSLYLRPVKPASPRPSPTPAGVTES